VAEERVSIFQRSFAGGGARLFSFLRAAPPRSADTAKERLQVLLALERSSSSAWPNFLPQLQDDIMKVIKKYVDIDDDKVSIEVERGPRGVDARHQRRAAGPAPVAGHRLRTVRPPAWLAPSRRAAAGPPPAPPDRDESLSVAV
jgi:cell division topological specificity factor